jgi:selenide,water dikinase
MRTLNRDAGAAMVEAGAHAATDITGFGLLGHAVSMARASDVTIRFAASAVPVLPRVRELLAEGVFPGGLKDNEAALAPDVRLTPDVRLAGDPAWRPLFDPQTSGGLLVSLAPAAEARFQAALAARGAPAAARIGDVVAHGTTWVEVI